MIDGKTGTCIMRRMRNRQTQRARWLMLAAALCLGAVGAVGGSDMIEGLSSGVTNAPTVPARTPTNALPPVTIGEPPLPPASTNVWPPAETNTPVATPPKVPMGASGTALLDTFGGAQSAKFSVVGRTLKLPLLEEVPPEQGVWNRHVELGMNVARGNSDTLRYASTLEAVRETELDLIRLRANAAAGESEGTKDTENMGAHGHYERMLSGKLYALANLEWWRDTIALVDYRVTGIVSPGLHLVRTEDSLLNVEVGAGYIGEKKDGEEDGYAAGRVAVMCEHVLNPFVLAWFSTEYLPKVMDPEIYFVNAEAGITSGLSRQLHLNVTLQERYDSAPVDDKECSDLVMAASLGIGF